MSPPPGDPLQPRVAATVAFGLTAFAAVLVVASYPALSHTYDEPAHLAAGLEWWSRGVFEYEPKHPPLTRIAVAAGPWLLGQRTIGHESFWTEGWELLRTGPGYELTLTAARLGILPFLFLGALVVWGWTRRVWGGTAAVMAVGLFSTLPPILAHAGVATTDLGVAATLGLALLALVRWLEEPTGRQSLLLGAAVALALLSKLTALLFLPVAAAGILAGRTGFDPRRFRALPGPALAVRSVLLAALAALAVTWTTYRFSVGPVTDGRDRPYEGIDARFGTEGLLHDLAYAAVEAPVPAPEFLRGVRQAADHHSFGRKSYLLGEVREDGWWYFFPVALAVKTPLPFLLLTLLGSGVAIGAARRGRWQAAAPLLAAAAIVASVLGSRVNMGVRHLLPVYVLFAPVAAAGAWWLWNRPWPRRAGAWGAGLLLAWQLGSAVTSHPDRLAWFSFLAGRHPDRVLVFSDLDWGQDLGKLADTLAARGVDEVWVAFGNNTTDTLLYHMGFPPVRRLPPYQPTAGWVAVDLYSTRIGSNTDRTVPADAFTWVEQFQPAARVGHTIRLYHIPPPAPVP